MRTSMPSLLALLIRIGGSLSSSDTVLAEVWPQRTVKVIVPLSAGTSVDVSARLFAEQLAARWGRPVIIENMPGADGTVAAKEFVSRGDQHPLLYSFAGLITINPLLRAKLPYDPARDLVPIATSSDTFLAIAVSSKLQIASLRELVAFARSHPTKLNWAATPGLPYFAVSGFQKSEGLEMVYVPYRDFNPALVDLGEGRIEEAAWQYHDTAAAAAGRQCEGACGHEQGTLPRSTKCSYSGRGGISTPRLRRRHWFLRMARHTEGTS